MVCAVPEAGSLTFDSIIFYEPTFNSLTFHLLTFHSLTFDSLTFNWLAFHSLTFHSPTFNWLTFHSDFSLSDLSLTLRPLTRWPLTHWPLTRLTSDLPPTSDPPLTSDPDGVPAAGEGREAERVRQARPSRHPLGGVHGSRGGRPAAGQPQRADQLHRQAGAYTVTCPENGAKTGRKRGENVTKMWQNWLHLQRRLVI